MKEYKAFFLKILEAIDFSENKEAFATEFLETIYLQSLLDLIKTLSNDKQEEIKSQFSIKPDNQEKVSKMLKIYFTEDQMQQSLKNAAKDTFLKYIQAIDHTLSNTQKENLTQILKGFSSQYQ